MRSTPIAIVASVCVHGLLLGLAWSWQAAGPAVETRPALSLEIMTAAPKVQAITPALSTPHLASRKPRSPVVVAAVAPIMATAVRVEAPPQPEVLLEAAAPSPAKREAAPDLEKTPPRYQLGTRFAPKPVYPELAQDRGQYGKVSLHVWVNAQGEPYRVEVEQSSSYALLDEAALHAVRRWRFNPARLGDVAVEGDLIVPIVFERKADD